MQPSGTGNSASEGPGLAGAAAPPLSSEGRASYVDSSCFERASTPRKLTNAPDLALVFRRHSVGTMILFLFFCSGATALVYEVIWSKYLALMLGSTIYAQTVVLAVFMGGLALGNRLIGARSDWLARPLAAYGCLEVAIGLYAFGLNWIYHLADRVFAGVGS